MRSDASGNFVRFVSAPPDLSIWSAGAVSVCLRPGIDVSAFPASIAGMLIVRLEGRSFVADGSMLPEAALIGPTSEPTRYRNVGRVVAYGLLLAPQTVMMLTGESNRWAADRRPADLDAFLPARGRALPARLAASVSERERIGLLFAWLRAAMATNSARHRRLAADCRLVASIGRGLDAASLELGIGARQLERRCADVFGMSPHRAYAIQRMQSTLVQAIGEARRPDGADLAQRHRYYDQSHMGRDMRRLAGAPLGRIVTASCAPRDELWAFNVGRQQASG